MWRSRAEQRRVTKLKKTKTKRLEERSEKTDEKRKKYVK